ncbi:MAG: signal peptidase I [Planctomycetota bacterium]|nr:MAG: signal peptidase I [Planctomycetota bacterium]
MNGEIEFTCIKCQHHFTKDAVYKETGIVQCPDCLKVFIWNNWNYFRREWLEIICNALIILIIFKANLFDQYVIPTSSMEPTLHGANHFPEDGGDKVLVNKFYYKLYEPKNWDVVVFNPPHINQLFIKRLIGLPNQKVQIINGDIYINNLINRKPENVESELLYTLYDSSLDSGPLEHFSEFKDRAAWLSMNQRWQIEPNLLTIDGGSGHLKFNYPIDDRISSHKLTNIQKKGAFKTNGVNPELQNLKINGGYDGSFNLVGDIAIDFEFVIKSNAGTFSCEIIENNNRFKCLFEDNGRRLKLLKNESVVKELEVNLIMGRSYQISFQNVDDRLKVSIDGKALEYNFKSSDHGSKTTNSGLYFYCNNFSVSIKNIRIRRDVFYFCENVRYARYDQGQITFDLKDDQYFFLGDNVHQSADSRSWGFVKRNMIKGKAMYVLWPIRIWPGSDLPPKLPFVSHRTRSKKIN